MSCGVVAAKGRKKPSCGCVLEHICVKEFREGLKGPKTSRVFEILFVYYLVQHRRHRLFPVSSKAKPASKPTPLV